MKNFRLIAVSLIFAAIFAVSASAQTATKIGVINTLLFDVDKTGITKYVDGMNRLEAEFKPVGTELQTLSSKIQTLENEIRTLQTQLSGTAVPVNQAALQTSLSQKLEEHDKATREFKFKQEGAKAQYERRLVAVMGPIRQDIGKAMQEYAKKNNYSLILDSSKLDQIGGLLVVDEVMDVTADFIKFYNARTVTATTTTTK